MGLFSNQKKGGGRMAFSGHGINTVAHSVTMAVK